MQLSNIALVLVISYLLGAIPFGYIIVKIVSGKDVRQIESGRTGGTNSMRAAGFLAGLFTVIFDVLKGFVTLFIVQWFAPGLAWLQVAAALVVIMGHNYSVYLIERGSDGKLHLRGGAGGAPCMGGAIALVPQSVLFILPASILVFVFIGYASITTMSIAFFAIIYFAIRAYLGLSPWAYVAYGVIAEILLIWALRPNIKRLIEGNERLVGLRAHLQKRKNQKKNSEISPQTRNCQTVG